MIYNYSFDHLILLIVGWAYSHPRFKKGVSETKLQHHLLNGMYSKSRNTYQMSRIIGEVPPLISTAITYFSNIHILAISQ